MDVSQSYIYYQEKVEELWLNWDLIRIFEVHENKNLSSCLMRMNHLKVEKPLQTSSLIKFDLLILLNLDQTWILLMKPYLFCHLSSTTEQARAAAGFVVHSFALFPRNKYLSSLEGKSTRALRKPLSLNL